MKKTQKLLNYLATQEEAVSTSNTNDMQLAAHSNDRYLDKPKVRSHTGGHFFLLKNITVPANNGAALNIAYIIKNVTTSATKAGLAAMYTMTHKTVYIRLILKEMRHMQPSMLLQTNNSMVEE